MTLIDKIVHYIYLLLFGTFLKFVYLSSEVEQKSDTILHNIHPGPFDPYGQDMELLMTECHMHLQDIKSSPSLTG